MWYDTEKIERRELSEDRKIFVTGGHGTVTYTYINCQLRIGGSVKLIGWNKPSANYYGPTRRWSKIILEEVTYVLTTLLRSVTLKFGIQFIVKKGAEIEIKQKQQSSYLRLVERGPALVMSLWNSRMTRREPLVLNSAVAAWLWIEFAVAQGYDLC